MHSRNRVSYSNEQKLFWVKLFKESHFSGKDAKLRFLNHVHYEARLKAGEFYDQFKKKKGYQKQIEVKCNHFICLLFSSYNLTVHFYVYICISLWGFDFVFAFLRRIRPAKAQNLAWSYNEVLLQFISRKPSFSLPIRKGIQG